MKIIIHLNKLRRTSAEKLLWIYETIWKSKSCHNKTWLSWQRYQQLNEQFRAFHGTNMISCSRVNELKYPLSINSTWWRFWGNRVKLLNSNIILLIGNFLTVWQWQTKPLFFTSFWSSGRVVKNVRKINTNNFSVCCLI